MYAIHKRNGPTVGPLDNPTRNQVYDKYVLLQPNDPPCRINAEVAITFKTSCNVYKVRNEDMRKNVCFSSVFYLQLCGSNLTYTLK